MYNPSLQYMTNPAIPTSHTNTIILRPVIKASKGR